VRTEDDNQKSINLEELKARHVQANKSLARLLLHRSLFVPIVVLTLLLAAGASVAYFTVWRSSIIPSIAEISQTRQ